MRKTVSNHLCCWKQCLLQWARRIQVLALYGGQQLENGQFGYFGHPALCVEASVETFEIWKLFNWFGTAVRLPSPERAIRFWAKGPENMLLGMSIMIGSRGLLLDHRCCFGSSVLVRLFCKSVWYLGCISLEQMYVEHLSARFWEVLVSYTPVHLASLEIVF